MKKIVMLSLTGASLMAAGYKIPESSINAMALSAGYVANANGADASYYNPANMAFGDAMQKAELAVTSISLSSMTFKGTAPTAGTGAPDSSGATSKSEQFFIPTLHYVSMPVDNWRFGVSVVTPAGLSKRWEEQPGKGYANEFTLETVELNPTFAYKLSPLVAIGGGVRVIYTSGVVKSASTASRDMHGSALDFGYNLALAFKPSPAFSFAAVYRSNVDLNVDGNAKLYFPDNGDYSGMKVYDGDADVSVPVPALLQFAGAYTFNAGSDHATTLEVVFERNYWSSYAQLDFNYAGSIGALTPAFDDPIDKHWKDSSTYRIGVTQKLEAWTLMAGFALDETPVPEKTLNFELPDSDATIYSVGARYAIDASWSVGGAALYDKKSKRDVRASVNEAGIEGTFKDASALLITVGADYRF